MKAIFALIFLAVTLWAQSTEKMSYQAVVRSANGALTKNTTVGMRISILQGTAAGASVYVETQDPTTNSNGLLSIAIGEGTVISGEFASIDWSSGPYFIKTETDISGGTNYTITGTSQLLSVPYALHAKMADSVKGGIPLTANHITKLDNLSGTNTGDQDLSSLATKGQVSAVELRVAFLELKVQLLSGVSVHTLLDSGESVSDLLRAGVSVSQLIAAGASASQLMNAGIGFSELVSAGAGVSTLLDAGYSASELIAAGVRVGSDAYYGQNYLGAKIAYILQSGDPGFVYNEIHGILVPPSDQSTGIQWFNGTYTRTAATASAIGAGSANTSTIVANQGSGNYAAQLCDDLEFGGYSDWYLPSKNELNMLYQSNSAVGSYTSLEYWSSTEYSADIYTAHFQYFSTGAMTSYTKDLLKAVRCARSF